MSDVEEKKVSVKLPPDYHGEPISFTYVGEKLVGIGYRDFCTGLAVTLSPRSFPHG